MVLRLCPARRRARLTVPARTTAEAATRFLDAHRGWLDAALARLPPAVPLAPGVTLPVADRPILLARGDGRIPRLTGGRLLVPGDGPLYAGRARRWLMAEALRTLAPETVSLAAAHALGRPTVRVGDPASRWGSCASSGRIAYSWRLILAPGFVRRAIVAHEVAHLAEPNHGPAFWRLAEQLFGGSHAPARAWLRANAARLLAYGADDGAGGGRMITTPGEG